MTLFSNSNAEQNRIELGYANIQTVKASVAAGRPQEMLPGVVVRIFPEQGAGETFAVSNVTGIVVVPLRPGQYCYDAFDQKGVALSLDPEQYTCFSIAVDQTTTIGVVVRAEQ